MIRKVSVSLAALAAMGIAGAASAQQITPDTFGVDVNINVPEVVSMWAGDDSIFIQLDEANANSAQAVASTLSHINNVAANIMVDVTDNTLPNLPDPTPGSGGGGINVHIWHDIDTATAINRMTLNAYAPTGAQSWRGDQGVTGNLYGNPVLLKAVGTANISDTFDVVYGANIPGDLPPPDTYDVTVTYTIVAQ